MAISYKDSGVNIDEGNRTVELIKKVLSKYKGKEQIGRFGGMYKIPENFSSPYLISSADGVGTKIKVAIIAGVYDTVGQDLVNHCVDDILVMGAKPLYFLDYFATGKLKAEIAASVVEGLAKACSENNCLLLGGETAEMPGFYAEGDFDLAGFITGIVEENGVIDGSKIEKGDILIGFPSTGLHTNGYSLARKIFFDKLKMDINDVFKPTGRTVGEELLAIHKSYLNELFPFVKQGFIKGLAHITGGGFYENIPRILPKNRGVKIKITWEIPPLFDFLVKESGITKKEAFRTFNMGIGMIAVVSKGKEELFSSQLKDKKAFLIGEITEGDGKVLIDGID